MNIAIIGAGWAGLAAALQAADLGHRVTIFEAGHTLGGRARRVHSPRLNKTIDNGQHILLGAYTETLALMRRLNLESAQSFVREPLRIEAADGNFTLKLAQARAPLHLLAGLAGAKGMKTTEKLRMAAAVNKLKKHQWQIKGRISVADWLHQNKQSLNVCQKFWYPLCVAAMNTPPEVACAQVFANVLRDSLGAPASASNALIPRVDLSELWPDQVANTEFANPASGITIHTGATVRSISINTGTEGHNEWPSITVQNQQFDGLILACNIPSTIRLLKSCNPTQANHNGATQTSHIYKATNQQENLFSSFINGLEQFHYLPIATLALQLERPWRLPKPMYMLTENRSKGHYGQWLFDCSAFLHDSANHNMVNVVISDANEAVHRGEAELANAVCQQLLQQTARFGPMPEVVAYELITEKRATFASTPGLRRPEVNTPWPAVFIAGDYTNTGYPAVLEGAVRSGREAALQLHKGFSG